MYPASKSGTVFPRSIAVGILIITMLAGGCAHSPRVLSRFSTIDPETNGRADYFAYTDAGGREVKHGMFVQRYESGAKHIEALYAHGKLNGKCVVYPQEGRARIQGEYRDGQPWHGVFRIGQEIQSYSRGSFVAMLDASAAVSTPAPSRARRKHMP